MFDRPYRRSLVTRGDFIECVCRARAGYVLRSGSRTLYRCPACANNYAAPEWQTEPLPHIAKQHDELLYEAWRLHRAAMAPEQIASDFRAMFEGRVERFEARYQAERAGKARAS